MVPTPIFTELFNSGILEKGTVNFEKNECDPAYVIERLDEISKRGIYPAVDPGTGREIANAKPIVTSEDIHSMKKALVTGSSNVLNVLLTPLLRAVDIAYVYQDKELTLELLNLVFILNPAIKEHKAIKNELLPWLKGGAGIFNYETAQIYNFLAATRDLPETYYSRIKNSYYNTNSSSFDWVDSWDDRWDDNAFLTYSRNQPYGIGNNIKGFRTPSDDELLKECVAHDEFSNPSSLFTCPGRVTGIFGFVVRFHPRAMPFNLNSIFKFAGDENNIRQKKLKERIQALTGEQLASYTVWDRIVEASKTAAIGAAVGAPLGSAVGVYVGASGGIFAPITIPIGLAAGSAVGGSIGAAVGFIGQWINDSYKIEVYNASLVSESSDPGFGSSSSSNSGNDSIPEIGSNNNESSSSNGSGGDSESSSSEKMPEEAIVWEAEVESVPIPKNVKLPIQGPDLYIKDLNTGNCEIKGESTESTPDEEKEKNYAVIEFPKKDLSSIITVDPEANKVDEDPIEVSRPGLESIVTPIFKNPGEEEECKTYEILMGICNY